MSTLQERLALAMAPPCTVTAADLARACGVRPPSVHEWINGPTKALKGPNAVRVAQELDVNVEWLTTGRGPMRKNQAGSGAPTTVSGSLSPAQTTDLLESLAASQSLLATVLAASIPHVGKVFSEKLSKLDPHLRNGPYVQTLRAGLEQALANQDARHQRDALRKPRGSAR